MSQSLHIPTFSNDHSTLFTALRALEKAIEEKEELKRLIDSYKNSSAADSASSTTAFQSQETDSAKHTVPHTPLPIETRMPSTTILTYELSGVKFDSHIVNELLAQQV